MYFSLLILICWSKKSISLTWGSQHFSELDFRKINCFPHRGQTNSLFWLRRQEIYFLSYRSKKSMSSSSELRIIDFSHKVLIEIFFSSLKVVKSTIVSYKQKKLIFVSCKLRKIYVSTLKVGISILTCYLRTLLYNYE